MSRANLTPFEVLWDGDDRSGQSLPPALQAIYGDWRLPEFPGRPYVYSNFVISHDGRISFNMPGAAGGGPVSDFNTHDQWLMGLLRARADAILVGDNTLRQEPDHIWTAAAICPQDAPALTALRLAEGRQPQPLQVFASLDGALATDAAVFRQPSLQVVVATTKSGAVHARNLLGHLPQVHYLALGDTTCDLAALMETLFQTYHVRTLLCEGGPRLYGSLLQAEQLDDEFLTHSPLVLGSPAAGPARPGMVEGHAYLPGAAPRVRLLSVRRAGDYLFVRSSYR